MEMYDFFTDELKSLKALTGIRQWENLNELDEPIKAINNLIELMIRETESDPFDKIKPIVKQRIIHEAILNDPDFIGLNAKFVRRALMMWWNQNGENVLFKIQEEKKKSDPQPVISGNYPEEILNEWLASVKQVAAPEPQMKPEEIVKKGKEWTSEIERKAVSTIPDPTRTIYTAETIKERNARIREHQIKAFKERNPEASEEEVKLFLQSIKKYDVPEVSDNEVEQ